jgi:preprotein translocase subunit YajC
MAPSFQQLGLWLAAQDAPASGGGDTLTQMGWLLLMIPIFYFIVIAPVRKEKKEQQAMVDSLKRGDEVITASGLMGTIADFEDGVVVIEIAKNVKVRMLKSSLLKKNEPKKEPAKKEETKEAKS